MLILRANPRGGHPLKPNHFPLHQDKDQNFGYLIGYDRTGDKILIPIQLAEQIANQLGQGVGGFNAMINKIKPKRSLREILFITLFGKQQLREMREQYQEGDWQYGTEGIN